MLMCDYSFSCEKYGKMLGEKKEIISFRDLYNMISLIFVF